MDSIHFEKMIDFKKRNFESIHTSHSVTNSNSIAQESNHLDLNFQSSN